MNADLQIQRSNDAHTNGDVEDSRICYGEFETGGELSCGGESTGPPTRSQNAPYMLSATDMYNSAAIGQRAELCVRMG